MRGEHNKTISEFEKEFRIERIFSYLIQNNNSGKDKMLVAKKKYLLDRLVQYTNLSSDVHGGPFGESVLSNLQQDETKFNETLDRFIGDSSELYYTAVKSTYLFAYLMDEKMKGYYDRVIDIDKD